MEEIAPRLRNIIPHAITPVGAEDAEELVQDSLAIAAQMLDSLERRGKRVTPGNVCHYVSLLMKSGRRSHGSSGTDILAASTQLAKRASVRSLAEPAATEPETSDEIPLGELLAHDGDDPAQCAARELDWRDFLARQDPRHQSIVENLATGHTCKRTASSYGRGSSWAHQAKLALATHLKEFFGEDAIADALRAPAWRANVIAEHERATCRAERRDGQRVP